MQIETPFWIDALFDHLTSSKVHGFLNRPLPHSDDVAATAVVSLYKIGVEFPKLAEKPLFGDVMAAFAVREASIALTSRNVDRLETAILALDLSGPGVDIRDRLISFAPVRFVEAQIARSSPDLTVGCRARFRELWQTFRDSHDTDNLLADFGWKLRMDGGVQRFQIVK